MDTTTTSLQAVGITSALILSGVYFGSSQLTVPILYRLEPATAATIFSEFFYRGYATVVPFAAVSAVSFLTASYYEPEKRQRLIGATVAVLSALIWTRLAMTTTIDTLLEADKNAAVLQNLGGDEVIRLLKQWHWMNFVRAGLTVTGGALGLWTLVQ